MDCNDYTDVDEGLNGMARCDLVNRSNPAHREALRVVDLAANVLIVAASREREGTGSSADRIDAWQELQDAMEKLEETES